MTVEVAEAIVLSVTIYFALGLLIAVPFIIKGAAKIDPAARTMPLRAKLLILPASTVLWPIMLVKWAMQKEPPLS